MRYPIVLCLTAAAAGCSNPGQNNATGANTSSANAAAPATTAAPATNNAAAPVANTASAARSSYSAHGFEPGWSVNIANRDIVFQSQNGPNFTVRAPPPVNLSGGRRRYATSQISITTTPSPCQAASGQTYADTVQVVVTGPPVQTLTGCGQ